MLGINKLTSKNMVQFSESPETIAAKKDKRAEIIGGTALSAAFMATGVGIERFAQSVSENIANPLIQSAAENVGDVYGFATVAVGGILAAVGALEHRQAK